MIPMSKYWAKVSALMLYGLAMTDTKSSKSLRNGQDKISKLYLTSTTVKVGRTRQIWTKESMSVELALTNDFLASY